MMNIKWFNSVKLCSYIKSFGYKCTQMMFIEFIYLSSHAESWWFVLKVQSPKMLWIKVHAFHEITLRWMSQNTSNDSFRWWLGAIRQQAISLGSVDLDLCHHTTSLVSNVLIPFPVQHFHQNHNKFQWLAVFDCHDIWQVPQQC